MGAHYAVYYKISLPDTLFIELLAGLNTNGWRSMQYQSRLVPLSLVGVRDMNEAAFRWIENGFHPNGTLHVFSSDVIVKNGSFFYLRTYRERWGGDRLEVGIISRIGKENPPLLQPFLTEIESLFKKLINGRKRRYMDLHPRIYSQSNEVVHQFKGQYTSPVTDPTIVGAALVLAESHRYLALRTISEKKKKNVGNSIDAATLQVLVNAGLVDQDKDDASLRLTPLGHRLNQQSHWMPIWLSHLLISKGIPATAIYIGLTSEGEEVDLLVIYQQEVWIFELKAGDFEANKAYPFQYRKVQFQANRVIVIASGKISLPAKKVFARLAQEKAPSPIMIEGLDKAEPVLTQLIIQARLNAIKEKEQLLSKELGINLAPFFEHLFYTNAV